MDAILRALDCAVDDGDLKHLIGNGNTPDEIFAGLVVELSKLDEISAKVSDSEPAVSLMQASLERLVEVITERAELEEVDVKALMLKAMARWIMEKTWPWPVLHEHPGSGGAGGDYREFSALKMFGYTVGKTNGWPTEERHKLLSDFMRMELPAVVEREFPGEYGKPMSAHRLKKVATHIANVCSLRTRQDPHANRFAIADWKEDLAFLKQEFYEREGLKFRPWPDPD